jgi:hypothetical protein
MKGKSYMGHEPTPLFETKVPENKAVTKFVTTNSTIALDENHWQQIVTY